MVYEEPDVDNLLSMLTKHYANRVINV